MKPRFKLKLSGAAQSDALPVVVTAPSILVNTTATVGETITLVHGTYNPPATSFSQQVNRLGVPVSGANDPTYVLQAEDEGATITWTEVPGRTVGNGQPQTTVAIGPIAAPSGVVPATQTINFYEKQLAGHAGHPMRITAGSATIISQVDKNNVAVSLFAITNNLLVKAGTVGNIPSAMPNGPYIVRVQLNTGEISTITVPIIANHASCRGNQELAVLAAKTNAGFAWLKLGDQVYMRSGPAIYSAAFSFRTDYLTGTGGYAGNTRICIRSEEPDTSGAVDAYGQVAKLHGTKMAPQDIGGTANHPIDFRDIHFFLALATGQTVTTRIGIVRFPNEASGVSFYNCRVEPAPDTNTASRRGNVALSLIGSNTAAEDNYIIEFHGGIQFGGPSPTGQIARRNVIRDGWGDVMFAGRTSTGHIVEDNFAFNCNIVSGDHGDFFQHQGIYTDGGTSRPIMGQQADGIRTTFTGTVPVYGAQVYDVGYIQVDNVSGAPLANFRIPTIDMVAGTFSASASDSTPVSSFGGLTGTINRFTGAITITFASPPPGTRNIGVVVNASPSLLVAGPTVRRNIMMRGVGQAGKNDRQGVFGFGATPRSAWMNSVVENNIILSTYVNGIYVGRFRDSSIRHNIAICDVDSNAGASGTSNNIIIAFNDTCETTAVLDNIANLAVSTSTSDGNTRDRNITLARSGAAYAVMMPAFNRLATTIAAAKTGFAPALGLAVADGGAMNPNGTYSHPLFPNGEWNDGSVYVP
jgi:hypothetical protein